jgi:hypothetical protein
MSNDARTLVHTSSLELVGVVVGGTATAIVDDRKDNGSGNHSPGDKHTHNQINRVSLASRVACGARCGNCTIIQRLNRILTDTNTCSDAPQLVAVNDPAELVVLSGQRRHAVRLALDYSAIKCTINESYMHAKHALMLT